MNCAEYTNHDWNIFALDFWALQDVLATGICINNRFLTVQKISRLSEAVGISGIDFHLIDQDRVPVHANVNFHIEVSLMIFLGLRHLRHSIAIIVLGGAWYLDQGLINDRTLLCDHTIGLEIGFHRPNDPLAQVVLFH